MEPIDPGNVWEKLGALDDMEVMQVLTGLYLSYEQRLSQDPEDTQAREFFLTLARIISQTEECNLNRR